MYCQYSLRVSLNRSLIKVVLADGFFLIFIFVEGGRFARRSPS